MYDALQQAVTPSSRRASDKYGLLNPMTATELHSRSNNKSKGSQKQPKSQIPRWQTYVDKWWLGELLGWVLSLLALSAVATILGIYEDQKVPNWEYTIDVFDRKEHFHITVNSIVSVLATIFKATLLIPIGAGMSQLKWTWFQGQHPLSDFQMFEMANRGALDAAILIWHLRGRRLACLGAFVIVSAIALDFSFQSLISYPSSRAAVASASLPRTNTYSGWQRGYGDGLNSVTNSMRGSILSGIYSPDTNWQVKPTCLTGNCTWETPYTSLAICGDCVDISNQLQKSCATTPILDNNGKTHQHNYCNSTLPNGQGVSGLGYPQVGLSIADIGTISPTFGRMTQPITAFTTMHAAWNYSYLDDGNGSKYSFFSITSITAAECGLYYCVNKYNTSIDGGVMTESVIDTWRNDSATAADPQRGLYYDIILSPPASYTSASENASTYIVPRVTALALIDQFNMSTQPFWTGNVTVGPDLDGEYQYGSNDLATFLYPLDLSGTKKMIHSLATAMTVQIRTAGVTESTSLGPVMGTAWQDVPKTRVNWGWMSLPITLMVLTALFLIATMVKSARQGVRLWKDSTLAAFYYPLANDGRMRLAAADGPRKVEKIAQDMEVSWQETEKGRRFI